MDTNSNIPVEKKVVGVEILHLDELGYGPQGKHTRREWRNECLEKLKAGKVQFEAWQNSWKDQIDANLPKVNFGLTLHYDNGTQEDVFDFIWIPKVSCELDFAGQEFADDLDARQIKFEQSAIFFGVTFRGNANFESATFTESAYFYSATFTEDANFESATFTEAAYFSDATFTGHSYFSSATFTGSAFFSSTTFTGNAYFESATFTTYAEFSSTTFTCDAYFISATFTGEAYFISAMFTGNAYFESATFTTYAEFSSATFTLDAKFKYCKFDADTYFLESIFKGDAEFRNAIFNKDVRYFATKFNGGAFFDNAVFTGDAAKRLGQMKKLAEENGQTDQALNFNALELTHKTNLKESGFWFYLFTSAYRFFSDYGRSFMRPIATYLLLLVFSFLLTLPFTDYNRESSPNAIANRTLCQQTNKEEAKKQLQLSYGRAAVEYALFRAGGVMDFTDAGKQNYAVNCKLFGIPIEPDGMRAWGIFKSIASLALLFLAALGLRNKYRIK